MAVCPTVKQAASRMPLQAVSNGKRKNKKPADNSAGFSFLAERTGLEPATPGVTGRYSNQLNYRSNLAT